MITPTPSIDQESFDALRHCLEREVGIALGDDKKYLIETRLKGILVEEGCTDWPEFLQRARNDSGGRIRDLIIDAMTTNETLWFRDEDPYTVLREVLLPRWAGEIRQGRRDKVRIWCSACSTGQEPYSVMITILEYARTGGELRPEQVEILATDISDTALATARAGRYNSVAMSRGMPADLRARYFIEDGRTSTVRPAVARPVTFRKFNLQSCFSLLGKFDAVLNRYVAIYFGEDFKRELYRKIRGVLNPGGVLFLGSSESLTGFTEGFQARRCGKAVYYEVEQESATQALERNLDLMRGNHPAGRTADPSAPDLGLAKPAPVAVTEAGADEGEAAVGAERTQADLKEVIARLKALNNS